MAKTRKPRKIAPQTQEKVDLVPQSPEVQPRPTLHRALQAVRAAVGTVLDLADAAAAAVTKALT
jgi:hypothetical protein